MKRIILLALAFITLQVFAQTPKKTNIGGLLSDVSLRNIGPAFMSGRIADIAIHPTNHHIWYVAVGSGGVWKTTNSGTTWKPIFDQQKSFSIGCVSIDPNNPHRIWVGTGENVGGRHAGFGDGIYRSDDDGKTWQNMGLKKSEHISKIIVHPTNSKIVWVAAQGPLWSKGGERGFYITKDGGKTWKQTLGDNQWVGVTDIDYDPRNPDVIYAATWQRHRTVANYIGGGNKTGIFKSEDGGMTWEEINKGIAKQKRGKIGLAVSPINPDVIYAAVEGNQREGAFYKSTDRGAHWQKQSNAVSGATGPHYYQELYASPHRFDKVYLADVRMQVTEDGGKNFHQMMEKNKHSDNHTLKFLKDDPNYLLVGTDGGLYESLDGARTWRFINNLPVTQFYKIAVDKAKPFYNVYGGTQDNSTERGPSRTDNLHGIANRDWEVVLFADGDQPAIDPENENIIYAQWQEGFIMRKDLKTGEMVFIQPQPDKDETFERYNWDAPILISPYQSSTIYFASQRVWKSNDHGDNWTPISGDLTQYKERFDKPIMGKKQSWDSPWDVNAMSTFNTITSLAISPVKKGIIYAGTDDGLIQMSTDEGKNWRKIYVNQLPNVPKHAFVNDIKADLFDANTVYVCLDNHKEGDYQPYIYKSTDLGKTWKNINGNLPKKLLTWRLVQDYKKPELLFAGTEFGLYFTNDGGKNWFKLRTNANISFRDLAIQKEEDDLVAGSFGRGIFILDDYSFLRDINPNQLSKKATLFQPRDSWWYFEKGILGREKKGSQGAAFYLAKNPPHGTTFTYYIKNGFTSIKSKRQKNERKLNKENKDINFPGWEAIDAENNEEKPKLFLTILNQTGTILKNIPLKNTKGFHRATWNFTQSSKQPISDSRRYGRSGVLVPPGNYKAVMIEEYKGAQSIKSDTINFVTKRLYQPALQGKGIENAANFWIKLDKLFASAKILRNQISKDTKLVKSLEKAYQKTNRLDQDLLKQIHLIKIDLQNLQTAINGSQAKDKVGEKNKPRISERLSTLMMGTRMSSYGPTGTHLKTYQIVQEEIGTYQNKIKLIHHQIKQAYDRLLTLGAPVIPEINGIE